MLRTLHALCVVTLVLVPGQGRADEPHPIGSVVAMEVVSDGSDEFGLFRGTLTLLEIQDPQNLSEYVWGGNTCPGRDLTEAQVQMLIELSTAPYMVVLPYTKNGQGGAKCLVRFRTLNQKFLPSP